MPCSHLPSLFVPPQHRRTSETSISPPGSSIGSPNRVICVSPALPLAQGPRDGSCSFQCCPGQAQDLGTAWPLVPAARCATSAMALRGAQCSQCCPPSPSASLCCLCPLLLPVPAAGVAGLWLPRAGSTLCAPASLPFSPPPFRLSVSVSPSP